MANTSQTRLFFKSASAKMVLCLLFVILVFAFSLPPYSTVNPIFCSCEEVEWKSDENWKRLVGMGLSGGEGDFYVRFQLESSG